ncbi:hypothetical protein O9H85_36935 [Paenibacillus filicis]|uniref:Heparin-sulfate lyase N-terminal domain-containing protein n=1 Tax=Paenibacillus gyeongsangnamensis TaxID=3388067 RepID=A0ABT4QM11_9BACL|nr:hypothetical protein [Paenibacillus filicis]MCZ8517780.1 hypothetical protein [Paenibacillus filicis]
MQLNTMERKQRILRLAADHAMDMPRLDSGFWFHKDLRDNYYFAIHLLAYVLNGAPEWNEERRSAGEALGSEMLLKVLTLQDQNPDSPMYGHWPLNLGNDPASAKPHVLPVELMGCLVIYFYEAFKQKLAPELKSELQLAILHIYQSPVYRHPLESMHHHEAKHTALKLLLGHQFGDEALLAEGTDCARRLLAHVRRFGFKEYGCLPWHWHWIQALTCAYEVVEVAAARAVTAELLELLWQLRADYYLRGAWVGAHSRLWPHDAPKDTNTPHDYIQFGDFPEPERFPRLEGAALYTYEVSEAVRERAIGRTEAAEVKRLVRFAGVSGEVDSEAHTYAYVAPGYAVGGVWERRTEFDNEQLRWDVSLPLDSEPAERGVNQLYFFHPGVNYAPGDDRHASDYGEVLLHKDAVIQLWAVPEGEAEALVGCLPKGEWRFGECSGFGKLGELYAAFYSANPVSVEEKADRLSVHSAMADGLNGIVTEVWTVEEAAAAGLNSLAEFAVHMEQAAPGFQTEPVSGGFSVSYATKRKDALTMALPTRDTAAAGRLLREVNGGPIDWNDYVIS